MEGRRQDFENNPELQRFVLTGVRPMGNQLGAGAFGSVEELDVNGLVCAGKKLHEALLEQCNEGVADIVRKYFLECQVMAEVRHPHVVQFLGLCYLEGSALPVLVMERLDRSLDNLLETSPGLPFALKLSIMTDVAQGLLYLHTRNPPIVHRDLSARNILLTSSLVAKISDLGNARIVNLQPGQLAKTLSRVPGTQVYMPPEAFNQDAQYGPRLDIFSFGHLALFTLRQVFPGTLLPHNYPDPANPSRLLGRPEVERRADYIQPLREQLGEQHPLLRLVCQCLNDNPAHRPSAEELLQQLRAQMGVYGRQLVSVKVAKLQVAAMSVVRTKEAEDSEIEHLRHDLQQVQEDRGRLQLEVEDKNAQLQLKDDQLERQSTALQERTVQINRQQEELQTLRVQIDARNDEFQQQLQEKNDEINRLWRELEILRGECKLRLKWERLADMPEKMKCPRSVAVDRAVYVTAGNGSHYIHRYDLETQQWSTLPRYQYSDFAMTGVDNQLTCVGGWDETTKKSNAIAVYSTSQRRWKQPYPPMNTPRRYPAVCTYHHHLVVAGGRDDSGDLNAVEVLNTSTHQWFSTTPLPETGSRMSYTIIHDTLYLLGGKLGKSVLSVFLPTLIQPGKPPAQWRTLTDTPLRYSTAVAVRGSLVAVGGTESGEKQRSSAIYMYDEEKNKWNKVEDLPTEREDCTCCLLPNWKIFAAGGEDDKDGPTSRVDVATVLN